ncbi:MAG: hypothetical protein H5U00_04720 [Clostridia bacterium]|nr:hypothetical protein [Clostridia bacterium]
MQLPPGQVAVLATFPSSNSAERAVRALETAGYATVQLDRISRYTARSDAEYNNPLAGRARTQTGLSLASADLARQGERDDRTLLGSDPAVSGYGLTNYGTAGGEAFLVTVLTSAAAVDRAREILRQHGGTV